jgi:KUP system potassium uptake protein
VPHVDPSQRLSVDDLGYRDDGITHVTARFGYMEKPDVPLAIRRAAETGLECPVEVDDASYFLSTIDLRPGEGKELSRWRKRLFIASSHITADAAEYFGLPREQTVILGSLIEL